MVLQLVFFHSGILSLATRLQKCHKKKTQNQTKESEVEFEKEDIYN